MPNPTRDEIAAKANDWFRRHCAGGPLARDTDAYNQVFSALPDLVSGICAILPIEPAAAAPAEHEQES